MKQAWLEATYDLIDEIQSQPNYKRLKELAQLIANDETIQSLIQAFQTTNKRYEDAKQYGTHHPDLKTYQRAFVAAKSNLYTHDVVIEYKSLEREIQTQLDTISKQLATSISPHIKYPNDIGILPKH